MGSKAERGQFGHRTTENWETLDLEILQLGYLVFNYFFKLVG
jgi:hypothetical protein